MESEPLARMTKLKLTQMCRTRRWNGYSKYRKAGLIKFIRHRVFVEEQAAMTLQAWFRRWLAKPRVPVNEVDIFTLEAFSPTAPIFVMWEEGKREKIYQFHCRTLLEYFFSTGKFLNPFTRKPVSARNLRKLQRVYFEHFLDDDRTLTFELDGQEHILTPWTDITRIRHQMKIEHSRARAQDQLREMLQGQCIAIIGTIIGLISDLPGRQGEIVSQVLLYIAEYHLPAFFTRLFDLVDMDAETAQEFFDYVLETISAEIFSKFRTDPLKIQLGWGTCEILLNRYAALFDQNYEHQFIADIKELVQTIGQ